VDIELEGNTDPEKEVEVRIGGMVNKEYQLY